MKEALRDIFKLEDAGKFEEAFETYSVLYIKNKNDYEVWKHFYFFLWTAIEDAPSNFHDKINLRHLLQQLFEEGKQLFSDKADFNFIAGYTISIFPYEYGDYDDLEQEGKQMLLKATQLDPNNIIYKMVYLGSSSSDNQDAYKQAEIAAAQKVLETYNGNGALNKYFRQVLYRVGKNASR